MLGFLVIVVVGLLVVNYFRNIDTADTFPTGTQTEEAQATPGSYTVAAGDTLWSISEQIYGSGYNWVDIRDANNIENPNDLEEGRELSIPDVEVRGVNNQLAEATTVSSATPTPTPVITASPTPSPSPTPAPTQMAEAESEGEVISEQEEAARTINAGGEYTVVRGDNLWDIAVAAYGDGYRWTDIAEANDLVNPSIIHAGNVLTIPA